MMNDNHDSGVAGIDPLKIEYRPLADLRPARRNARTHSAKQVEQLAAAIGRFGFTSPLLVDTEGRLVAGHGRLAAARRLGISEVPVIELAHLTEAELRLLALADNRLAELAGWDEGALRLEFGDLQALDIDFDLEITGFSTTQIDLLLDGAARGNRDDDPVPAIAPGRVWIVPGDVWVLGDHRLFCGDARLPASFDTVMAGERARMVFSDPPYNVRLCQTNGAGGSAG
jgi:hypothetical protein